MLFECLARNTRADKQTGLILLDLSRAFYLTKSIIQMPFGSSIKMGLSFPMFHNNGKRKVSKKMLFFPGNDSSFKPRITRKKCFLVGKVAIYKYGMKTAF